MIIKTKKDISDYIKNSPVVVETKTAYGDPEGFEEIEKELVSLIAGAITAPEYGNDWGPWLKDNIDELLQEAISIVM